MEIEWVAQCELLSAPGPSFPEGATHRRERIVVSNSPINYTVGARYQARYASPATEPAMAQTLRLFRLLGLIPLVLGAWQSVRAELVFETHVRPILKARCWQCH